MTKLTMKTGTEKDFFKRGRQLAWAADHGEPLPDERTISFEDLADLVKEMPGSITEISERLHRDRSAVKRDVDELERAGLVMVAEKVLPGHGRMKEVRATAHRFSLQAEIA